jgi:hypothetical protein
MNRDIEQEQIYLTKQLSLLRADSRFPDSPAGEASDAAPPAKVARATYVELSASDAKLGKAFAVGWFGVIPLNTPDKSRRHLTSDALPRTLAFQKDLAFSDRDVLDKLAQISREEITKEYTVILPLRLVLFIFSRFIP